MNLEEVIEFVARLNALKRKSGINRNDL